MAATIGLIFRIIEDRSKKFGAIITAILGMVWSLISFLVIPVLVVEGIGPIAALKKSTSMLKKTWGEQIIGNFSFGFVFFLLFLPAMLLVGVGFALLQTSTTLGIAILGLAVIYGVIISLIQATLQSIFQAALYLYARDGKAPAGFYGGSLEDAVSMR